MKIGVISDSHDNIWNLELALKKLKVDAIIHCGDFCAPFMVAELEKAGVPVHAVWGNTDDRHMTSLICEKSKLVTLYGELAEIELGGKRIAFTHLPNFADALAKSGKHDAVFHGHTHEKYKKMVGKTLLANPGEIMGRIGKPTYGIYDTEKNDIEFHEILLSTLTPSF